MVNEGLGKEFYSRVSNDNKGSSKQKSTQRAKNCSVCNQSILLYTECGTISGTLVKSNWKMKDRFTEIIYKHFKILSKYFYHITRGT